LATAQQAGSSGANEITEAVFQRFRDFGVNIQEK
jgi:hypothetical protein